MKKIVIMITLVVATSIMAVSCKFGVAYWDCVSSCNNKANALFASCFSNVAVCTLVVESYKDSCKKGCE